MQHRKVTYRLYPKPVQTAQLRDMLRLQQQLYNGLLEQRIWAYRAEKKTLSYFDQCKEITALRKVLPEYEALSCSAMRVTAKRVNLAFQAFFRRLKKGDKRAGFPRFRSLRRFSGWGYKTHGDGWRLHEGEGGKHGRLSVSGVGYLKIRGKARNLGTPKTMEILLKDGRWYASVTLVCDPKRKRGRAKIGMDWGVTDFATIAHGGGKLEVIANPQHLKAAQVQIKSAQRQLSKKKRGSNNRNKARRRVAQLHQRVANRRHDFLHKTSAALVENSRVIVTEKLAIKNMTRSAKGTKENPGKNVKQKAGPIVL